MKASTVVRTLLGSRQVPIAKRCLASMFRCSHAPIRLVFHDDGTLRSDEQIELRETFPGAVVLTRKESDQRMAEILSSHPTARRYRAENCLGLKLLDVVLLADTDICFVDTDILFFRPFECIFEWPNSSADAIFMEDYQNAYCTSSIGSLFSRNTAFVRFLNSGVMYIRRRSYDLDYVEWLLSDLRLYTKSWGEQTCWAALAARMESYLWSGDHIRIVKSPTEVTESLIAGHFVSGARHLLDTFDRVYQGNLSLSPVRPAFGRAKICSRLQMAGSMFEHEISWCKHLVWERVKSSLKRVLPAGIRIDS